MGRLTAEVGVRTRRILYGELSAAELAAELRQLSTLDQAHRGDAGRLWPDPVLGGPAAAGLHRRPARVRVPAATRPAGAARGIYLMYEGYLISRLGAETGECCTPHGPATT